MEETMLKVGDVIYDEDEQICIITQVFLKTFMVIYYNSAIREMPISNYKQVDLAHKYVFLSKLRKHGYCWNNETMQVESVIN